MSLTKNEAACTILEQIAHGVVENGGSLDAWGTVKAEQAALIREVYGNPFRPVDVDPAWLAWNDGTAVKLARAAYDQRDPESGELDAGRVSILADALEEAGCIDQSMLGHLRGSNVHVRGCWAIDLILHGRQWSPEATMRTK